METACLPERGYLLPEGWEPLHVPHLARRGAALRRQARTFR